MAEITVEEIDATTYRVTIDEPDSSSQHMVTVGAQDLDGLPDGSPSKLVDASFRFLLDREPKESILSRFELGVISRYFPEYKDRIADYL